MGRHEAAGAATGVDFHLPDEILAVIPTDPYEQLDIARKITSMAISSRVSHLEADVARLRRDLTDRDRAEADLRARLADSDARLLAALDENAKLAKERDSLAATAKKLERNLAKLEAFKKQSMKSLSEDNLLQLPETDQDLNAEDNLTAQVPFWKDEVWSSHTPSDASSRSTMTESAHDRGQDYPMSNLEHFWQISRSSMLRNNHERRPSQKQKRFSDPSTKICTFLSRICLIATNHEHLSQAVVFSRKQVVGINTVLS